MREGVVTVASKSEKAAREAAWRVLYARAEEAGELAGESVVPQPMYVVQLENPFDDNSAVKTAYAPVMDGVCGFAWVLVEPATSSFARWLKAEKGWTAAYGGGISKSVRFYNQSMTRKEAYAFAFAKVLREAGVKAYGESRMD